MKNSYRISVKINDELLEKHAIVSLESATILDDANHLIHRVLIETELVENDIYQRLKYSMATFVKPKTNVVTAVNAEAEQFLYKIAMALHGSSIGMGTSFRRDMIIRSIDQPPWDNVLPSEMKITKKGEKDGEGDEG